MGLLCRRILLIACAVLASASIALAQAEKVYVTKTGEKYHRESCRSLAKSKIEMTLKQAAARYGPCKNCQPPTLAVSTKPEGTQAVTTTPTAAAAVPAVAAPKSAPATSGRCQATTKRGTQCSRNAQAGRNYCWQH